MGAVKDVMSHKKNDPAPPVVHVSKELYLGPVHVNNVGMLECLTKRMLPVSYSESFYSAMLKAKKGLVLLAYYKGIPVGSVCCRLENRPGSEKNGLYVLTLGVLPAYQGLGIASALMEAVMETAKANYSCSTVWLHVWTTNDDAIGFYEKKMGFSNTESVPCYYSKIDPPDAFILEKEL